jgi:hypothetical protein
MAGKGAPSAALPPGKMFNGCVTAILGRHWTITGLITPYITGSHTGSTAGCFDTLAGIVTISA